MPQVGKYWIETELYHAPFDRAHTWAKLEPENLVRVGFDDFAQRQAGELLCVRLLPAGEEVKQGELFGTVETSKWVGQLLSPVSGKIAQVNEELLERPKLVNEDPYEEGWMVIIDPTNLEKDLTQLVTGKQAIDWLKKDIREITKEAVT